MTALARAAACTAALILSGCAPMISGAMNAGVDREEIVTKTATYFGTTPGALKIENIEKHTLATTYQTTHKGTFYNCRIYYGAVECKQPGT